MYKDKFAFHFHFDFIFENQKCLLLFFCHCCAVLISVSSQSLNKHNSFSNFVFLLKPSPINAPDAGYTKQPANINKQLQSVQQLQKQLHWLFLSCFICRCLSS